MAVNRTRVAMYYASLSGGGGVDMALSLAKMLIDAGYDVDFVLNEADYSDDLTVANRMCVVPLESADASAVRFYSVRALRDHKIMRHRARFVSENRLTELRYLPSFVEYLQRERPALVIANLWSMVLVALFGRACVEHPPSVVGVFHSAFFREVTQRKSMQRHPWRWRHFFALCRHFYSQADALVTVSDGVGRDLVEIVGVSADRVETLPNPVVFETLIARAAQPLDHPWLTTNAPPLVVAVGRLSAEKNYSLLLRAFAKLRTFDLEVRLAILGDGDERPALEKLCYELGVAQDVLMPGWSNNPCAWMQRAALVASSSNWEGLPTVLIEALACGCPVVATDCPHGPREILDNGRYGRLVALHDPEAFAVAMADTIDAPRDSKALRERAQCYSVETATQGYRALVERVLAAPS